MKTCKRVRGLLAFFLAFLLTAAMLPSVFAAGTSNVSIGSTKLKEGENSIGGGTATLNTTERTLILENVSSTEYLFIDSDAEFTIIVKGDTKIGSADSRTNGSALFSNDVSQLNIQVEQGAVFSLYTAEGNNIFLENGALKISGPGKFVANVTGDYPAIYTQKDIVFDQNLIAEVTSEQTGVYSNLGNITIDSVDRMTVKAQYLGLFAQSYDSVTDDSVASSITMRNSTVEITTAEESAVFCGAGGILIEDTSLMIKTDKEFYGYGLYSEGDVVIKGSKTDLSIEGATGISADKKIIIEGGTVDVSTVDTALLGWDGVTITEGIVNAESEAESAILARDGACSISGDATSVTAITNAEDKAAIRNAFDGGIYLDAAVKAENTAGGKPVEGVMKDKTEAITIGAGFDAFGLDIYTTENGHSYFIPAGSDGNTPWAGEINICKHVWNAPVWSWSDDYSAATATFVCTKDETHKEVVQAVITSTSKDATCGENGVITYRASLTFNGTVYEDEQSKVIPATGNHSYKDGICTVCGASDPDYQPTEPEEPGESETPSEPSEPSEPVDPSTPDDSHPTETPATGYNSNAVFVVVLLFLSGAGALGMTIYSRKKTKRE